MKNQQVKQIMSGAVFLSLAAFIAKVLSAVYRVPFQNMVGDTGFYVYQQVYPIYGIGMTFALSGLPVYLSKVIAETNQSQHKDLLKKSFAILFIGSFTVMASLFLLAKPIARAMGDEQLAVLIQTVAGMFAFIPVLATIRGYFQGVFVMKPTAVSQVMEQLIRVAVILFAAYLFGLGRVQSVYEMGAWAMSGAVVGAFFTALYVWIQFKKNAHLDEIETPAVSQDYSWKPLAIGYLTEGLALCLVTSMLILFQLVDSFTLFKELVESGIAPDVAKVTKGIYDRGQPLVQLGMVVATGFSASFLPLLTNAIKNNQALHFHRAARSLIRISLTISSAAFVGLAAILPELNVFLFGDRNGTAVLTIYVAAIVLASLILGMHALFASKQQYRVTVVALAAGLFAKTILNQLLVVPFGTIGASVSTVSGLLVMIVVMARFLPLSLKGILKKNYFGMKLVMGSIFVYTVAWFTKALALYLIGTPLSRMQAGFIAIGTVVVGVLVFLLYSYQAKLFTTREWVTIPLGKKLVRFLQKWDKKGMKNGEN